MITKTKKELINEYKQQKQPMGVFRIRNTINAKVFIGSSLNLGAMWNRLRLQLDTGSHPNADLQKECMPEWNATLESGMTDKQIRSEVTKLLGIVYRRMLIDTATSNL